MNDEPELKRVIGAWSLAFTIFNACVGAGIFGLPALVAGVLGSAAILAYGVCLVLIGLVCLCLAEAGSRVPASGGVYAYAAASFGPVLGGATGSLYLVASLIGSSAALARFFVDTLATVWPAVGQAGLDIALIFLIYAVLALINIFGARGGARLAVVVGIAKFVPLILLVIAGLLALNSDYLAWPETPPVGKIGEGALILVFAFIGIESGLSISGETRNPSRTIPRAVALAVASIATLYVGLQVATQGVLGPALAASSGPIVDTASFLFGPWGGRAFIGMTLLSVGGFLVADVLSSPRLAYAMADSGQLPRFLAFVHPRYRTPSLAIIIYSVLAAALAASGTFRQITLIAVAGTLSVYLVCCLGVLRLRAKGIAEAGPPFVVPGGPLVPIAAAALSLWLLSTLAAIELIGTIVFAVVAALLYAGQQRLKARPAANSRS